MYIIVNYLHHRKEIKINQCRYGHTLMPKLPKYNTLNGASVHSV